MTKTDREQVQEVMAIYGGAVDEKDYNGITACFMKDATFLYEGKPYTGHAAIEGLMRSPLEALDGTQHLFTNFIIDIEGDTARLSCDSVGQHWRKGTPGGDTLMAGGKYKVDLKKVDGKWKISGANAHGTWGQGNPKLLAETEAPGRK